MQNLLNNTIVRELSCEDILSVYTTHSIRHFPKSERKPVNAIRKMAMEGLYKGYAMYENDRKSTLLCYAFFVVPKGGRNVLLDYFAVMEEYRSIGTGSMFLQQLKASFTFDGVLIEVEDPDFAPSEEERTVQEKRIAFYEKNGTLFTGIRAQIFDVPYRILFLPVLCTPSVQTLRNDFKSIYRHMVSPQYYEAKVFIRPCEE